MRLLPLMLTTITTVVLLNGLTGCARTHHTPTQAASNLIQRQSVVSMSSEYYPAKNPQTVAMYNDNQSPHTAYRVIGIATISKYNLLGSPRQDATMNVMMKNLAASMGGDGLINVSENSDAMQAHIIAYQKILI